MASHKALTFAAACALLAWAQAAAPHAAAPGGSTPGAARPQRPRAASARPAASLCRADEQVLFSCRVAAGAKLVSVCGSRRLTADEGYVQYRFGRAGAVELEFPRGLEGTQKSFRYSHYFRARVDRTELSFESGGYGYALYDYYEGDVRPAIKQAGVRVTRPGGEGQSNDLRCRGAAVSRLGLLSSVVPNDEDGGIGDQGRGAGLDAGHRARREAADHLAGNVPPNLPLSSRLISSADKDSLANLFASGD